MGYAVSASAIAGVLNGCKSEVSADWLPQFLSAEQGDILVQATERILPATDTPGANDVGVHEFIDQLLQDCLDGAEKKIFTDGLLKIEEDSRSAYKKSFVRCSVDQQNELFTKYDQEAFQTNQSGEENAKKPFFTMLKELTLLGYFTSEKVGEEVLAYDPVPAAYQGCIPFEEGDRAWSL